jgi:hypothetical protein
VAYSLIKFHNILCWNKVPWAVIAWLRPCSRIVEAAGAVFGVALVRQERANPAFPAILNIHLTLLYSNQR